MVRVLFINFFLQQNRINLITSAPMIVGKLQFVGLLRRRGDSRIARRGEQLKTM